MRLGGCLRKRFHDANLTLRNPTTAGRVAAKGGPDPKSQLPHLTETTLTLPTRGPIDIIQWLRQPLPQSSCAVSKSWNLNQPTFQILGEQVFTEKEPRGRRAAVLGPRPASRSPELPLPVWSVAGLSLLSRLSRKME